MKEEKGITLITLITYIIVLLIAISVVTLIVNYFMKQMNQTEENNSYMEEINQFNYAFLSDIKQEGVSIYSARGTTIILEYENGKDVQYIYQDNQIYRIETVGEERTQESNQ